MTVIDTSTASTATAYSNQRKIDRCQNGVLWVFPVEGDVNSVISHPLYSTDDGATWNSTDLSSRVINGSNNTLQNYVRNLSLFIDLDDFAHVVFKDNRNGYIYYRRGTPNAARTAWTWSSTQLLSGNNDVFNVPDIVAHREGTGWVAHIVFSRTGNDDQVYGARVETSSGGAFTVTDFYTISDNSGSMVSGDSYPSIDFNHTGDGKTVAGGTPHLYLGWSARRTGSGFGIRFKKATYSGGSWTWGTEREIDSTRYIVGDSWWINCLFDGTRVVVPALVYNGTFGHLLVYERDAADTATIIHELSVTGHAGGTAHPAGTFRGSSSYDSEGNIHMLGRLSGVDQPAVYKKWVRSTDILEDNVVIDTTVSTPWFSLKRGYSNNLIEFIYTDGTSSPYDVTYGAISLNTEPNVPTNLAVTSVGTDTTPVFEASISDPETSQQIKARFEVQTLAGTSLGTLDSAFRTGAGTVTAEWADALATGQYQVRAQTIDDAGAESAFTDWLSFSIAQPAPPKDLSFLWNTIGVVPKDLNLLWNITEGNLKDLELLWNVTEIQGKEVTLLWNKKTPWREVTEDSDIWRKVYL